MFLKIDGRNLLQIYLVVVSSCDIPITVLESVDRGEYRVFLSKCGYTVHSGFCIGPQLFYWCLNPKFQLRQGHRKPGCPFGIAI